MRYDEFAEVRKIVVRKRLDPDLIAVEVGNHDVMVLIESNCADRLLTVSRNSGTRLR